MTDILAFTPSQLKLVLDLATQKGCKAESSYSGACVGEACWVHDEHRESG